MLYKCLRCGYENNLKSNFRRHLLRKFKCQPILEDISIDKIYQKYFKKEGEPKLAKSEPKLAKSEPKLAKSEPKLATKKVHRCKWCNREFKHLTSKIKHEKSRCKKLKNTQEYNNLKELVELLNDQLKQEREDFKKEINKKDKQIERLMKKTGINIGTINNINNIENNIKILAYNKSDLSHLTDQDYQSCFNRSAFCIPHLVRKIHFNPCKPENHNIYISNIKNSYVMSYNGDQWDLKNRDEVINDMIISNECILEDKLEDWILKGKEYPDIMKKFQRYLEKKENDIVKNKIKEEIKLILFNNRKMILNEN